MSAAPLLPVHWPHAASALRRCSAPHQLRARRRAACRATQLQSGQRQQAVSDLLSAIEGTDRGVRTTTEQRKRIFRAISALEEVTAGADTARDGAGGGTDPCSPAIANASVSAVWKLLWTTEKVLRTKTRPHVQFTNLMLRLISIQVDRAAAL